jgi:MFS family permease
LGEIIKDPRRQARATTNMFSLAGVGFLSGPFLASSLFSELRYGFIFAAILMILGGLLIHLTLFVTLFSGPADKTSTSPSPLALEVQPPALTAVLSEDHVKDQGKRGPLDSLISAVSISPIHSSLDSRWPAITCLTASSPMTSLNFSTPAISASSTCSSTCSASPRTSPVLTAEFSLHPRSPPALAPAGDR